MTAESSSVQLNEHLLTKIEKNRDDLNKVVRPSLTYWQDAWIKLRKNKIATFSLALIVIYICFAVLAPMVSAWDPASQNADIMNQGPSSAHWFGTDPAGRDLWVRNWVGARVSLFIGVVVVLINTAMGCLIGGISGYFGGKADLVIMRIIDVLYGIPMIILAILMMVVFKPGVYTIILAMVSIGWIGSARMVRGQILSLKNSEFILAAKTLGAGNSRIIVRHLIPNIGGILITTMTMSIPNAIFVEAFLSFIGIGVQPPMCSWGSLAQLANQVYQFYPYQLLIPAFFICTTVLAFNLLGDGLRDALDPRTRGSY
ncbi:MAG: ABC transporter permease [Treponema sp.]|nr:ABC transporter permease [Treponema sp.]